MKLKEAYLYILGAILVISFMVLLALLIFKAVPEPNSELLYLTVGALIGFVGSVVSYFFGSSLGSKQKTEIMANGNKPKEEQ